MGRNMLNVLKVLSRLKIMFLSYREKYNPNCSTRNVALCSLFHCRDTNSQMLKLSPILLPQMTFHIRFWQTRNLTQTNVKAIKGRKNI